MGDRNSLLRSILAVTLVLTSMVSISAYASFFGFGGTSWKEEALQNDGSKIMVTRSQSYGGRHMIGDIQPIKEQSISFALPNTGKVITWKDEATQDIGYANFNILALHVLNSTPYLVTAPDKCLSYNKWGRPNPPYVFFKFDGSTWHRISLSEFQVEFKNINLVIETRNDEKEFTKQSPLKPEVIQKFNSNLSQPEFQTIARTPGSYSETGCLNMVSDGKSRWLGIDWFTSQPSIEACLKVCTLQDIDAQHCPCNSLFKGK